MTVVIPEVHAAQIQVIEAPSMGLEALITNVAEEYGISSSTLFNLAYSESRLDPNAVGDSGESIGLVQIRLKDHPDVTREMALDPLFSLRFAAKAIKEGREYQWSVCSCISTARNLGVKIPPKTNAKDLVPNTGLANIQKGDLVLFKYKNGMYHVAVFDGWQEGKLSVSEGNMIPCLAPTKRLVDPAEKSMLGVWHPGA